MPDSTHRREPFQVALRKESVDRNFLPLVLISPKIGSLSARRAWIEIRVDFFFLWCIIVALRKESVDRNSFYAQNRHLTKHVALRKESVDRNNIRIAPIDGVIESLSARRAWIEICLLSGSLLRCLSSLSARRAWIEISTVIVILRKRNTSLSARRAWIEIQWAQRLFTRLYSRSPQGERG